jgi:hypothetical protein
VLRTLKGVHLAFTPLQAAGRDAGLKLMEVKRLRAKGHRLFDTRSVLL